MFCARLEEISDGPIDSVESLLNGVQLVVITKAEDDMVSRAGYRNKLPESGDPWDRYRAAGLTRDMFVVPATGESLGLSR